MVFRQSQLHTIVWLSFRLGDSEDIFGKRLYRGTGVAIMELAETMMARFLTLR
jgi:hypothetical protein